MIRRENRPAATNCEAAESNQVATSSSFPNLEHPGDFSAFRRHTRLKMFENVDSMLSARNKDRELHCRVCRRYHNPITDHCGCEPR
jgi:hypothetical protein